MGTAMRCSAYHAVFVLGYHPTRWIVDGGRCLSHFCAACTTNWMDALRMLGCCYALMLWCSQKSIAAVPSPYSYLSIVFLFTWIITGWTMRLHRPDPSRRDALGKHRMLAAHIVGCFRSPPPRSTAASDAFMHPSTIKKISQVNSIGRVYTL